MAVTAAVHLDRLPRRMDRLLFAGPRRAAIVTAMLRWLAPARLRCRGALTVVDRGDRTIFGRLALGLYERGERAYVARVVDSRWLFVDVGANCGLYTALAAARGARVIALEPDPRSFARLQRTAAGAAAPERVTLLPVAADATCGSSRLYRSSRNRGDLRLAAFAAADDSVEVRHTTLDLCVRPADHERLFIKLDVQGWEARALAGAAGLLSSRRRVTLLFEFHPDSLRAAGSDPAALLDSLVADGFALFGIDDRGARLPLDPDHGQLVAGLRGELFTNLVAERE